MISQDHLIRRADNGEFLGRVALLIMFHYFVLKDLLAFFNGSMI